MCMQPDDMRAGGASVLGELREVSNRDPELRARPSSSDVHVVAATNARVHADENLVVSKEMRPTLETISIVDCNVHSLRERPRVLGAGGKIGGVEDALRLE